MIAYFKEHKLAVLFLVFALFSIFRILGYVYDGYYIISNVFSILALLITDGLIYVLIIGSLAVIIRSIFKKQHKMWFTVFWVILTFLRLIPSGDLQTLGALLSIQNANPSLVRDDSRMLLSQYEPMTHFGYFPGRPPFDKPISKDKLPASLRKVHIGDVLILENYVFIEKHGLSGLFRGFVVFREGFDIWRDERSVVLQEGCSTCWKIRIIDGLYWFHDEPQAEDVPTFVSTLK
jgi:hypothetical protein